MQLRWPRDTVVKAYLKPEARECAAYVLVPRELKSITFEVDHVNADIDGAGKERRRSATVAGKAGSEGSGVVTVTLPPWTESEARGLAVFEQAKAVGAPEANHTSSASIEEAGK